MPHTLVAEGREFSASFKSFLDGCLLKDPKDRARACILLTHEFVRDACSSLSMPAKRAEVPYIYNTYICIHTYLHTYISTYISTYLRIHIYIMIYVYIYVYMMISRYVCMYIYVCVYIYIYYDVI